MARWGRPDDRNHGEDLKTGKQDLLKPAGQIEQLGSVVPGRRVRDQADRSPQDRLRFGVDVRLSNSQITGRQYV